MLIVSHKSDILAGLSKVIHNRLLKKEKKCWLTI